jgi:hypothetical protein
MAHHQHDPNSRRALNDARGIFCGYVCDKCEAERRADFRSEIFADPDYHADEPIEAA